MREISIKHTVHIILILITIFFISTVKADDVRAGHYLRTFYVGGSPAPDCSVRCFRLDIDWVNPQYYTAGYSGYGAPYTKPPYYNECRFIDNHYSTEGYDIEPATYRGYIYYAFRSVSGQMRYSPWSAWLSYPYDYYYGHDDLTLSLTSPPSWPPEEQKK